MATELVEPYATKIALRCCWCVGIVVRVSERSSIKGVCRR